jgi:hypothetical protein
MSQEIIEIPLIKRTLEHKGLLEQYVYLRNTQFNQKFGKSYDPQQLMDGDEKAGFLVAVGFEEGKKKVIAGIRLNELPATGGETHSDRIKKLEELLPGIKRQKYASLNIDFATVEGTPEGLKSLPKLFSEAFKLAEKRRYDVVYFFPEEKLSAHLLKTIEKDLQLKSYPLIDFGNTEYKGMKKRMFAVLINSELRELVPPSARLIE